MHGPLAPLNPPMSLSDYSIDTLSFCELFTCVTAVNSSQFAILGVYTARLLRNSEAISNYLSDISVTVDL